MGRLSKDYPAKFVILGTARKDFVLKAINSLKSRVTNIVAVVNNERNSPFPGLDYDVKSFAGHITKFNISLLATLRQIKPGVIVVVIGDQFIHKNVFETLKFWMRWRLLNKSELYVSYSFDPDFIEYWDETFELPASTRAFADKDLSLLIITPHPRLGWINRPADLTVKVTRKKGAEQYQWRCRIDRAGARFTSEDQNYVADRPLLSVFGPSEVFGVALNDDEVFSWILQEKFSSWNVRNYGAPDYSLHQSCLALEERFGAEKPKIVILGFSARRDFSEDELLKAKTLCEEHDAELIVISMDGKPAVYSEFLNENGFTWPSASIDPGKGAAEEKVMAHKALAEALEETIKSIIAREPRSK